MGGYGSIMPSNYAQSLIAGQAMSGVSINIIDLCVKAFKFSNNTGGIVYYGIGSVIMASGAVSFYFAKDTSFSKHYIKVFNDSKMNLQKKRRGNTKKKKKNHLIFCKFFFVFDGIDNSPDL